MDEVFRDPAQSLLGMKCGTISRAVTEPKRRQNPSFAKLVAHSCRRSGCCCDGRYLMTRGSDPGPTLQTPVQEQTHLQDLEFLRSQAPDVYSQNRTAIDALDAAIEEILADLESRPDDDLLKSRLAYYRSWQSEMVFGTGQLDPGEKRCCGLGFYYLF